MYGKRDPSSDICDGCIEDCDTGWFGFTDHRVSQHFNNRQEQLKYYRDHNIEF